MAEIFCMNYAGELCKKGGMTMARFLCLLMVFATWVFTTYPSSVVCAQELRLGAIFPLTGPLAYEGNANFRGVELAIEAQNEKGGILGRKIKLVTADAPDPKGGAAEAERLITLEKINLIMGTFSSSISYSASEVANKYSVPYFEVNAISDVLTERGFKYFWRTGTKGSDFAQMVADFSKEALPPMLGISLNKLRIAIANEDTLYGTTNTKYLEKTLPAAGLTNIVAKESYSSKSVDFSSLIIKMKAMKPDVFMVSSYTADAILLVRQAKEMGFNVKVWQGMGAGYGQPAFAKALGKDSDYILDVNVPSTYINRKVVPGLEDFMRRYQKKYGEAYEGILSQYSYTGAVAVLDIIRRAGSLEADAIARAAWDIDIPSWSTPVGWGVKFNGPGQPQPGQNGRAFPYISQWKNEQEQVIWPPKARYTDPILPMPTWKERGR